MLADIVNISSYWRISPRSFTTDFSIAVLSLKPFWFQIKIEVAIRIDKPPIMLIIIGEVF